MRPSTTPRHLRTAASTRAGAAVLAATLSLGVLAACSTDTASAADSSETETESPETADPDTSTDDATTSAAVATTGSTTVADALAANVAYEEGEADDDASSAVVITFEGDTASADGDGVTVDGGTVTITAAGTYVVSGTLTDGQIVVDSPDDGVVRLVLDGADITSATTSPLQVSDAGSVVVVLADGSTNTLTDAATYVYADGVDEPNAALFSTADLTITGAGALDVTGSSYDGITSKDGLVIAGGDITVTATDDGVRGKDYLVVTGGTLTVEAGGDGLKADNDEDGAAGYIALLGGTTTVTAGDDGVVAQTDTLMADGALTVDAVDDGVKGEAEVVLEGGSVTVTASTEGVEAATIALVGADVDVTASDDGVNAASDVATDLWILISAGSVLVDAEGDGIDANGAFTMTGGDVVVNGPAGDGNGAFDVDGAFEASGGTLLGVGSAGMAVAPSADSAQGWLSASVSAAAGSSVVVTDASGAEIAAFTTAKQVASVVYSAPEVTSGESYTVTPHGAAGVTVTAGEHTGGMGGMGGGMPGVGGMGPGGAGGTPPARPTT